MKFQGKSKAAPTHSEMHAKDLGAVHTAVFMVCLGWGKVDILLGNTTWVGSASSARLCSCRVTQEDSSELER